MMGFTGEKFNEEELQDVCLREKCGANMIIKFGADIEVKYLNFTS